MFRILRFALNLVKTVICGARIEGDSIIISVRPYKRERFRCPVCKAKCSPYDTRCVPRHWRALNFFSAKCYLEYSPCRVRCTKHGVHVEDVPWARPNSRFTRSFEDQIAWMSVHCTRSTVAKFMSVDWHTVGGICKRVYDDLEAVRGCDRFDNVTKIGIDETGYRKGRKFMTVVVDHDRGSLIWAHEGYGKDVLNLFFEQFGAKRAEAVEVVTADGASWVKDLMKKWCPNAEQVMDPFHVISWMNDALEAVRRGEWAKVHKAWRQALPKRGRRGRPSKGDETPWEVKVLKAHADAVKGMRFPLLVGRENMTDAQRVKIAQLQKADGKLFRAWELKEDLRAVFKAKTPEEAEAILDAWLRWACRSKIPEVVEVSRKVRARRDDIIAAVRLGISNGRVEAINNKIKVTVRMGYGFRNIDNMIALLMLRCSDIKPQLPCVGQDKKKPSEGAVA